MGFEDLFRPKTEEEIQAAKEARDQAEMRVTEYGNDQNELLRSATPRQLRTIYSMVMASAGDKESAYLLAGEMIGILRHVHNVDPVTLQTPEEQLLGGKP